MEYFSDQEKGLKVRSIETVSLSVWGGIVALIRKHWTDAYLGFGFPEDCPDGKGICGCNVRSFLLSMKAEIPEIGDDISEHKLPDTLAILDLIQFCYQNIAKATAWDFHGFFGHSHYNFDEVEGRRIFREEVERIFLRNGIAFRLEENGKIIRTISSVLVPSLKGANFNTGDQTLDGLLNTARERFISPDPEVRRDSLEKLWDAWERLKTLENQTDKKESIKAILDKTSSEPKFRELLEEESRDLTNVGNTFRIRHSEISQIELKENAYVDYLFHRLFSIVELILKATHRLG